MTGPLHGVRVVEFEAPGPVAWAGMMLADLGAQVTRIVRPGSAAPDLRFEWLLRGRETLEADLMDAQGLRKALDAIAAADVVVEGMRPGVMERLGLGPDACFAKKPSLVYGRMTGWGRTGRAPSSWGTTSTSWR